MPKHNKRQIPLSEVYAHYKETTDKPVDYKTHKKVLDLWGKLAREALAEGKDIKLFAGLASLGVRKRKKHTFIDRKQTALQKKRVMATNSHSGFFTAKCLWRRRYTTVNSVGWSFHSSKALQMLITNVMNTLGGHSTYLQRAQSAYNDEARKKMYNSKVVGL